MIDRGNMRTHAFPVDYTNKKYFSTETGFGTSLDDNTAFQTFVISSDILHIYVVIPDINRTSPSL